MKLVRKDASKYIADSWKRYLKYKIQLRDSKVKALVGVERTKENGFT
jgi:hypothetical protein